MTGSILAMSLTPLEKPFTCRNEGCKKHFLREKSRDRHEIAAHSGDLGEYPCDAVDCTRVFKSARALEQHFSRSHILAELSVVVDSQQFWCICNRKFNHFEDLRRHHRDAHKEANRQYESSYPSIPSNSSYICSCRQKFDNFGILREHHGSVHQSEVPNTTTAANPYPCTYDNCKRSFHSNGALSKHMVVSHGIRSPSYISTDTIRPTIVSALRSDCPESPTSLQHASTLPFPEPESSTTAGLALKPPVQTFKPVHTKVPNNSSQSSSNTSFSPPTSTSSFSPLPLTLHPYEQQGHNVDSRYSTHTTMSGVQLNITINGSGNQSQPFLTDMIQGILGSVKNMQL